MKKKKLKLELRNKKSCDGCEHLIQLSTLGGHVHCSIYNKNMLPQDSVEMMLNKSGRIKRLDICIEENDKKESK